jgi:hypothetical protein
VSHQLGSGETDGLASRMARGSRTNDVVQACDAASRLIDVVS